MIFEKHEAKQLNSRFVILSGVGANATTKSKDLCILPDVARGDRESLAAARDKGFTKKPRPKAPPHA
jgi:hypothetical protein